MAKSLRNLIISEYGSSRMDMVDEYLAGTISWMELSCEFSSSGLSLVSDYVAEVRKGDVDLCGNQL